VRCQSGALALSIRALPPVPTSTEALGLPPSAARLAAKPRGLILVTGPTGSGKSTTLATLIQQINMTRACHVITIEDPIEYVFPPGQALIEQRQVMRDAVSYEAALHAVLRQDPDVVMIGELRNTDTLRAAVNMAEAGHLTMATAHAPTSFSSWVRVRSFRSVSPAAGSAAAS
jgi:twitching motility protein PilT